MASVNFQKIKMAQEVKAKIRHDDMEKRLKINHKNLDIDKSKTHLNLNYFDGLDYEKVCKKYDDFLAKHDKLPNANKRKDRVTCVCLEIPTPDGLPPEKEDEFFYKVGDTLCEIYGKDNLLQGYFHKDEQHKYYDTSKKQEVMSKNHATFRFIPFVKDADGNDRLLAKEFTAKAKIIEVNNKIHDMCGREFGVPFNNGSKKKGKSVEELKRDTLSTVKQLESLAEATRMAIINKAKKEAESIINEAKAKADRDYSDGYDSGYADGKEDFHKDYELPISQAKEDTGFFGKSKGTISVPKDEWEVMCRAVKTYIADKDKLTADRSNLTENQSKWNRGAIDRQNRLKGLESQIRASEEQTKRLKDEIAELMDIKNLAIKGADVLNSEEFQKRVSTNAFPAYLKKKGLTNEYAAFTANFSKSIKEAHAKHKAFINRLVVEPDRDSHQSHDDFEL